MYQEIVFSFLVSLLCLDICRSLPVYSIKEDRKLTNYFKQLAQAEEPVLRNRRSIITGESSKLDLIADLDDRYLNDAAETGSHPRSRRRRSAALMLSAAIHLCNQYAHLCRTIRVKNRDQELTIRVADE